MDGATCEYRKLQNEQFVTCNLRYFVIFSQKWPDEQYIQMCIQKFPDWQPGARTANDTALCH